MTRYAQRNANGYLTMDVAMAIVADEPMTTDQITRMQDRANELASRLALETTTAG